MTMGRQQEGAFEDGPLAAGYAELEHRDRYGRLIDRWTERNLIVNDGLDGYLDARLKGASAAQASTWFVGLIAGKTSNITLNSTDAMTAHGGWSESTGYSNASRPKWESGTVSGQSVNNSTATATFNINASTTAGGVFLCSTDTKGGTGGLLHSEIKFSQTRSMSSGDTLDVTYTQTMAFSST